MRACQETTFDYIKKIYREGFKVTLIKAQTFRRYSSEYNLYAYCFFLFI